MLTGHSSFLFYSICNTRLESYARMQGVRPDSQSHPTGHGQQELPCGRNWGELFVREGIYLPWHHQGEHPALTLQLNWGLRVFHHSPADAPASPGLYHYPHPLIFWLPFLVFIFSPLLLGHLFQGAWLARTVLKSLR